jgi:hypothetical protein
MRIIVEILIVAFAASNNVPPIDRLMMLLANQSSVLISSTDRNGTPRIVKIAMVAMQEPTIGNQPAGLLTNAPPTPTFAITITTPSTHDRYRSARNERNDDMSELADAGEFPNRTKCRA